MRDSLEITTRIGCVNNCDYCPQDKLLKAYEGNPVMTIDQFKTILSNTQAYVQIDFAGFCEPFLNPDASTMMRIAIELGYDVVLDTTLTGFTERDAEILKGLRFNQVYIHDYTYSITKSQIAMLDVVTDKFEIGRLEMKHIWSRAGNLWERVRRKGVFECGWTGKRFYRNVVLPNGNVYICCMDYSLKHCIGNMFTTHYNHLDREKILRLSNDPDSDCICRYCEIINL